MNMNKTLLVAGLLSAAYFFGVQAMDSGNKILAEAKLLLQEDDNTRFDEFCKKLPA